MYFLLQQFIQNATESHSQYTLEMVAQKSMLFRQYSSKNEVADICFNDVDR